MQIIKNKYRIFEAINFKFEYIISYKNIKFISIISQLLHTSTKKKIIA